jgi:dihydrofolate reductase
LIENNLLDELRVQVHPVIVGKGKRLFENADALQRLKLVESSTTGSGVILLTYQPRD